ncbi:uncharacterized protein [Physcomitrium patens]|uniref:Uncharacterized protein n=1 Tax=Physcomitrium patens TaxID=3218 RepID=A0A2K1JC23_PHYPA|nr:uncharacterized protein LOC112292895 isoform X2 [Physcomitrium patens]PNR39071.1 hypothetical protein PHYPA_019349 [Physcomitrium patens]|eukprot:XP_024397632.1 uncharacterized protein LOC112292895 isoform X2 [Physcomitrella patens]
MSREMALDFFPVTFGDILKKRAPEFFAWLFPDWIAKRCPMPSINLQIPGQGSVTLFWPVCAILISSGFLTSLLTGTPMLIRALREGARARQGLFAWSCAMLWYGCMCLGGLFFHCLHIRKIPHMMDVSGTGLSSLFVIAGFAAFKGILDDRTTKQRLTLLISSLLFVIVGSFSPRWLQEQLYVVPSLIAAGTGIVFIQKSPAKSPGPELSSEQRASHKAALRWLNAAGLAVVVGLAAISLDKYLCVYLGTEFTMLFWFFLGCNAAIFFVVQFAHTAVHHNLQFTHVKVQ